MTVKELFHAVTRTYPDQMLLQPAVENLLQQINVDRPITVTVDKGLLTEKIITPKTRRTILRALKAQLEEIAIYSEASEVAISLRHTRQRAYLLVQPDPAFCKVAQSSKLFIIDLLEA